MHQPIVWLMQCVGIFLTQYTFKYDSFAARCTSVAASIPLFCLISPDSAETDCFSFDEATVMRKTDDCLRFVNSCVTNYRYKRLPSGTRVAASTSKQTTCGRCARRVGISIDIRKTRWQPVGESNPSFQVENLAS